MHRVRCMALLGLLLLALAPAAAQSELVDVRVELPEDPVTAARGDAVVVEVVVTNPSSNPYPGNVNLTTGTLPPGWSATFAEGDFGLAGGQSRTIEMTLRFADDAEPMTQTIEVHARITYGFGGQTFGTASDTATLEVTLKTSIYQDLEDTLGGWLLFLFAGLILIVVGIAIFLVVRPRPLQILPAAEAENVAPGGEVLFRLAVRNPNRGLDKVTLGLEGLPEGWTGRFDRNDVAVRPGRQAPIVLAITAPKKASESAHFFVTATSGNGREGAKQELVARIRAKPV